MRKNTTVTQFIQEISVLLDRGVVYSVDEVQQHIENKDLVDWLEEEFPFGSENGLDLSMFERRHRDYIHEELESIFGGYAGQEERKWGIVNNGLCLVISWSTEILRSINGLSPQEEWIN